MEESIEESGASEEQKRIAKEIEAVFERFYKGKGAYTKGQFYRNEFFLRTDYALVFLSPDNDIYISFADHTRPSYSALFTLLLDEIPGTNLYVCEDYRTDMGGSMVCDDINGSSTGAIIWDQKERYYTMLKEKVEKVVVRKMKKKDAPQENGGE